MDQQSMIKNDSGSHLVLIVDLNHTTPVIANESMYCKWLDSVITLISSHLLMSANNLITVIATNSITNRIIYPSKSPGSPIVSYSGQYELFAQVTQSVANGISEMVNCAKIETGSVDCAKIETGSVDCAKNEANETGSVNCSLL